MGSEKSFYLLETFHTIPTEKPEEWLGRIVKNHRVPLSGFTPNISLLSDNGPFNYNTDPSFKNVRSVIESFSSSKCYLDALGLFGLDHGQFESGKAIFESALVDRLRVQNDEKVLEYVCAREDVRAGFDGWGFGIGSVLYFIVGMLVTDDISYKEILAQNTNSEGSLDVAKIAATALPGGTSSIIPIQLRVGAQNTVDSSREHKVTVSGKRIFAIEYRRIRKKLITKKASADTARGQFKRHGLRGDRTFTTDGSSTPDTSDMEARIELDLDPIGELMEEEDGSQERLFS